MSGLRSRWQSPTFCLVWVLLFKHGFNYAPETKFCMFKKQGGFFNTLDARSSENVFELQRSGSKASSLALTYSPACCGS
jgi:hypothetical protein